MNGAEFLFTLVVDGLVLIAVGTLCRWAMPARFTVRRLLVVTAVVAIIAGIFRVALR
jgi:hypothetical protein